MLAAMFLKQLPIQIVVADSKTQVWIGSRLPIRKSVIIVSRVQIVIYAPGTKTNQALALFQKW